MCRTAPYALIGVFALALGWASACGAQVSSPAVDAAQSSAEVTPIASTASAASAVGAAWPVAGRQGIVWQVIVPVAEQRRRAAYVAQTDRLCPVGESCFVNFYANPTGAALAIPLPDAIANEPLATMRRSLKKGAEAWRFACTLEIDRANCF